jgi:hypothetical protein
VLAGAGLLPVFSEIAFCGARLEWGDAISDQTINLAVAVGIPSFVVLVGILVNNRLIDQISRRFDDHRQHIDRRFNGLEMLIDNRFEHQEKLIDARFQHQDEKLRRVEEVLDARLITIERELKMR